MATISYEDDSNQDAAYYMNKKGINELFEAMMTALMIHKPDDHITFIRECLDKVENDSNHIRWDSFLIKSLSSFNSTISIKQSVLPPIEYTKRNYSYLPIIFILSSLNPTKLCSRLLERYNQIDYLLINNLAKINENKQIDLNQYEYRYDCIQQTIDQHRSQVNGFLIVGELDEQNFLEQWQKKLKRIDLIFILSSNIHQTISNSNIIQIDFNNDFNDILSCVTHFLDELFPQNNSLNQYSQIINHSNLPILFCIDNHDNLIKDNDEFNDDDENNSNNSFIYTLCQRLAEEFLFKYIHYEDRNFKQLKTEIIQSMNTCSGYIIDNFPTSFNDLKRFQSEIGSCSVLIYIGEHQTITKHNEINSIIEKFKDEKKAIYINCHMEVDEIYQDLKNEIFEHI